MRISDFIAQIITQRRALVWSSVAVLALGCIATLVTQLRLDSDVLNILPASFRSVAGLKIYDREFEQTRQLTFALVCAPDDVEKLEEFALVFADKLRQQPWCTRVLAGSPMQTPDGIRDLQSIAVPLLLNLEPGVFNETISILQPQKIRDRLHRLHQQIDATLIGSAVLVGSIFFIGFRRWLPLLGMGFSLLLSCLVALTFGLLIFRQLSMVSVGFCAILVGLGVDFAILTFGRYQQARIDGESHRHGIATSVAKLGRAVFFGALTTAVGFLALILSGSLGFSQLGVLIAIGIFFAGLFMCTILFLFVRVRQPPVRHDWVFEMVKKYVRSSVERPAPILIFASALLLLLTVIGFSPVPPLHFEASTRSLEPKNSRASRALQEIMHKMPIRWEPVIAIVQANNSQELHDDWQTIAAHWSELQTAGKIKSFSTPAALCLSPKSMRQNREQLSKIDFQTARQTLDQTLDAEGFSRDAFAPAFTLLDNLQHLVDPNAPLPNWREKLPASSSWWFLIDRSFAQA